jgi:sterol 3beta-glucosyltransferase
VSIGVRQFYSFLNSISSWFLDNPDKIWQPSPELLSFMQKARDDGKPLVYIGFGSITVPDPQRISKRIVKGVLKSELSQAARI